jgi:methionyl-tRNA formyltransferase
MLKKENGKIDWRKTAEEIRNLIRGTLPWPGAFTNLDGKLLKIYKARFAKGGGRPGEVIKSNSETLRVATGSGALDILELQIEGGKRLQAEPFLRGKRIKEGTILGD